MDEFNLPPQQQISLDTTTTPPPEQISLDTGTQNMPLTPQVASSRAEKAKYGLADVLATSYDEFYRRFISGQEPNVRREAAANDDLIRSRALNRIIQQTAAKTELTPEDVKRIKVMVDAWKPSDPNSIIEDAYSVQAMKGFFTANNGLDSTDNRPYSMVEDVFKALPDLTGKWIKDASVYGSKVEFLRTLRGNLQTDLDNQSTIGWVADQAKSFFQLYNEVKLRGNLPIDTWGGLGTSLEEQSKALFRMPYDQMKTTITRVVDALKKDNPALAAKYLEHMIGKSSSDEMLENAFTLFAIPDITAGAKIIGSAARKAFLATATRSALKDAVKSLDNVGKQPLKTALADGVGDLPEAAINKAANEINATMHGGGNVVKETAEALQDVMRLTEKGVAENPGHFGQEIVNRLAESYKTFKGNLFETIERIAKVERITPVLASEVAIRALKEEIAETYVGLRNSILNISNVYKRDLTNTYHADIIVGNPNGGLFLRPEVAEAYARYSGLAINPIKDIGQQGTGFYVRVTKPVNETSHVVRDFLTETATAKSPTSWLSAFAQRLRTPEETLAYEQLLNRKVATYAPSELIKVADEAAKPIKDLAKYTFPFTNRRQMWNEWERAVKFAQDAIDPHFVGPMRPGESAPKGYFFKSPAELEVFYEQNFKRLPSIQEVEAYYAFKRLGEMDYVLRNISIYKFMSRVGAENHVLYTIAEDGKRIASSAFAGVARTAFPGGEDTMLWLSGKANGERLIRGGTLNTKDLKQLKNDIKTGLYKVIEIYDPELRALKGFTPGIGEERIRWVIVKNGYHEAKPLDYVNMPYRGGGHFEYDYEHYIKQANMRFEKGAVGKPVTHWYEGDTTVAPIAIRAMGQDLAQKMNAVRLLIKQKDIQGAKELAGKTLPWEWNEFYSWFKGKGKESPRLNVNEPFHVVARNKKIKDVDDSLEKRYDKTFKDGTTTGSLARQYQVQYAGERDAVGIKAVENKGSATNPLYRLADPSMLDPIPTMNRALSRITNSFFMDDYKISAIEHWLKEAQPFLKASESELRYSPFHHFNTISANAWRTDAAPEQVAQLTTRWHQIKQFTGVASETEALVHSFSQKLSDSIYGKIGPDGLRIGKVAVDTNEILSRHADPVRALRSLTFHMKLGLFAVPQLLVQSQTFVNILGVAGFSKAAPGTFAALLHQYSRINPTLIDGLDRFASKLHIPGTSKWRPGEFKEAWQELKNTGFSNVGGEYALRDDLMSHKVIGTGADKFLDAGTFFFKEGERGVRLGAWYTAYREFRDANPLGKITDANRRDILQRASLLNVNMDRSSNSLLQHGVFSIPMQFLTYQVRAAELFLGKRLTGIEKARLLGWNATLYGVPTSLGLFGYPFGDHLRQSAIDNGVQVNEGWVNSVMNGLPAALIKAASGNQYNIGERYGSQGFTSLRDALNGDKTMWDLMGGAAFSTLSNTWTASDGFRTAMMQGIRGEGNFKLKPNDVLDIFKEISSVNAAWRMGAAIQTGRWMSKTETWTSDVTPLNAIFQTVSGLQDQEISDVRMMIHIKKTEKALAEYSQKKFVEEFQRGLHSQNDDPKQGQDFFSRAFAWLKIGGFPENRYGQAITAATKDNENLISRVKWDFYTRDVPASKKTFGLTRDNVPLERMDAYRRDLNSKGQP